MGKYPSSLQVKPGRDVVGPTVPFDPPDVVLVVGAAVNPGLVRFPQSVSSG